MSDLGISQKLAKELSSDNLREIRKVSDELVKNCNDSSKVEGLFCQVIQILSEKIGPSESLDSFSDDVITNYFYLVASSRDYEEFFRDLDQSIPVDYESILYKAIELQDTLTVLHIVHKKPELLNIQLRTTFSKQKMKKFLLKRGWGEDFRRAIEEERPLSKREPHYAIEEACFEEVKVCVSQTVRRKAA
jgi:hypothetical protein